MNEVIRENVKKIQFVLLDLLTVVDKFCRENAIKYSLAYGTALGAVRHKGFIPWDDDADIFMERYDYERFIKLWNEASVPGYTLYATDNPNTWLTHTKLYKDNTAKITKLEDLKLPEHHEIFLDIFPLDKVTRKKRKRRKFMFWGKLRLVYTRDHPFQATNNKFLKLVSKLMLSIPKRLKRKIREKGNRVVLKYNDLESNYDWISLADPVAIYEFLPPVLDEVEEMEFEGHKFFVYKNFDQVLRVSYGDYMKLPPVEDRMPKHNYDLVILDTTKLNR